MKEADVFAAPDCYDDLIAAMAKRAADLGLSQAALDRVAGLAYGYSGKVFGGSQTRKIGWFSTFLICRRSV